MGEEENFVVNLIVCVLLQKSGNSFLEKCFGNVLGATFYLCFRVSEILHFGVTAVQPQCAIPEGRAGIIPCTHKLENAIKVANALPGWWQDLLGKCNNVFN